MKTFGMIVAAGLAMPSMVAAETTLIFGEPGPNRGARAEATDWFVDEVARLSEGSLAIDVTWGGALFSDAAALQSLQDGVADLGTVISVYFPQEMVGYGIADLPLDNPDSWVGMRATDDLMRNNESLQADLESRGLIYLGTYTTSAVQMGCRGTEVQGIEDISDLRVRGVGAYGEAFRDLGANLVSMSVYDAYQALDTGMLDCTQTYSYLISALRFDEVFDSYTLIDWGQIGGMGILMNRDMYDALEDDQQAALMEAGEGLADAFGEIITQANEDSVQILRDQGKPVHTLGDDDRAQLVEAGLPYVETWIERADASGLDGEALLAEYRELIAHYTEVRDTEGYPWERN